MKHIFRLTLLSVLAVMICSCNNRVKNTATNDTSKAIVHDNGVNIAYADIGKGDTTLLFVHGWCINKGYWSTQVNYFAKKYRVVAMDLPGFGESGKNRQDWSTAAFSHDVDSVINQLHLKKLILIGHSMAGDIVLQAAIDNPQTVIGLVGVDNFKGVGKHQTKASKKGFANAIDQLKHNFKKIAFMYVNEDLFSPTTDSTVRRRVLNDVAHADTTIATASMAQGNDFDEVAKLRQAKLKLYLINSDVQPADTTGFKAHKLPYHLLYIHGTGHFPMIEDSDGFNLMLQQAIADIGSKK
jgi:pimeloyl-ACP methyl ester carboxylesterase